MPADPTLTCPHCKKEIHLTESLAAPLVEAARAEMERNAAERERAVLAREQTLIAKAREVENARTTLDEQVAEKLRGERAVLIATEAKKARAELADEIAMRDEALKDRDRKLAEARGKELALLKAQAELQQQREAMELDVQRTLNEERARVRDDVRKTADEENRLRMAEKDKVISDMQKQVEEMRRKAEQGSQQLQGEVLELELEALLRATFPVDAIEPVPKGVHGGDVVHRVRGQQGHAGVLLWELKNTKAFQTSWLPKLRDDQRAAKADLAILVSDVLPKEIEIFGFHDGVWITSTKTAMAVALCLRQQLVEVASARKAGEGLETKMELVYQYMTGPSFRTRVHAIVEAFSTMKDDLEKERRAIMKQWSKREAQLARALVAATGMYGDLQGIAGQSLQELDGLALKALEAGGDEDEGA